MVLFFDKNGKEVKFEDIGYEIFKFILVLLEGGKYAVVATKEDFHEGCLRLLQKQRADLVVISSRRAEGGGTLTVYPKAHFKSLPQTKINFFVKSGKFGEADPVTVERLLCEAFPDVNVTEYPKE